MSIFGPLGDFWNYVTGKSPATAPPASSLSPKIPWQVSTVLIIGGTVGLIILIKKIAD